MEKEIFDKIEGLGFPENECIVLGSAVMQAKGIRVAGDLEFLVGLELFEKLKEDKGWVYKKDTFSGVEREFLGKEGIDVFKDFWIDESDSKLWKDFKYFMENTKTEKIKGISFISLKYLLYIKCLWAREKDLKDVVLIIEYLRNQNKS